MKHKPASPMVAVGIVEQFRPFVEQLNELTVQALALTKPIAESVIAGQITDENRIEHLFDDMLSYGHSTEMTQLFKRVCRKIYDSHPDLVNFYVKSYLEMWDDSYAGGGLVVMKHNQDPKYPAYALLTTEARRKQYEYYRDKLLIFKEFNTETRRHRDGK
jgi:ATP sulfurylase